MIRRRQSVGASPRLCTLLSGGGHDCRGNLGFPRIGRRRALKSALERYWAGASARPTCSPRPLRATHWQQQQAAASATCPPGTSRSTTTCWTPPACSARSRRATAGPAARSAADLFRAGPRLARHEAEQAAGIARPARARDDQVVRHQLSLPRAAAGRGQRFDADRNRPLAQLREAQAPRIRTRPVLLGPVSFLLLAKTTDGSDPLALLPACCRSMPQILRELAEAGGAWVQIDEPVLALDLPERARAAFALAYATLGGGPAPEILLASYFGPLGDNLATARRLPVAGLHLDLVRGPSELDPALAAVPRSAGSRSAWWTAATSGAPTCAPPWPRCSAPRRHAAPGG